MRSLPNIPLSVADIQLSSPLPSPSRQSAHIDSTQQNNSSQSNSHQHPLQHAQFSNANVRASPITPTSFNASTSSASYQNALPSLNFEPPYSLNPQLYPLKNRATPASLKKFVFKVDGVPAYFEEIQASSTRKRPALIWEDERRIKRTELDITSRHASVQASGHNATALQIPTTVDTNSTSAYSPGPATYPLSETMLEIIPDSPNSALPSPVSDMDQNEHWLSPSIMHTTEDSIMIETSVPSTIMEDDTEESKTNDTNTHTEPMELATSETDTEYLDVYEDRNTPTFVTDTKFQLEHQYPSSHQLQYEPTSLVELFDKLPEQIQSYFMFQLLRRTPSIALREVNDIIKVTLKRDYIKDLPAEVSQIILNHLDVRTLCRACGVSRKWKSVIENASDVWETKMIESDFSVRPKERTNYSSKEIVRRHTIMRRNWRQNLYKKMLLDGHEDDLVTCLQFDDEKIVTGSDDHSINVYDINTGELKRVLKGHDGGVWALQYVGNVLVTGSIDRTVRVWDIERGICRFVLRGHSSTVRCLKIVMPTEVAHSDGSVTIEPKEPIIVSGSRDMTIRVWRLPNIEEEPIVPLSTSLDDDVISKRFLKYKLVEHENSVRDLAIYGNTLVSGSYDNNVIIWDLGTGKRKYVLRGHTMKVYCVSIDQKRRRCISGSLDATVRIWDIDTGECEFILQGHAILVGLLGLVGDSLVSAAADATLRIWDPSTGDRLYILAGNHGHQGPITSFQHDKYKIVSGSEGGVKMWDTQTGKFMYDLIEDVAGVWRVAFDERRCIAAVKNEHRTQLVVLDYGVHGLEEEKQL